MTDRPARIAVTRLVIGALVAALSAGCIRGRLPPREFYRLAAPDSVVPAAGAIPPPLSGSIAVAAYDTPGIYGSGGIVYRVGASQYGVYPSREWAIPLGEMLGMLTETAVGARGLTSGRVEFDPPLGGGSVYAWRGAVREFDEVDGVRTVSTAVSLAVQLVRIADDSVVWSGAAREAEPVLEARSMDSVVAALSAATARALARLADEAAAAMRRLAASGAHGR